MHSVDSALNAIWRSDKPRPMVYSFAVYWMILTLGPLLAGASLAISSYLLSLRWVNVTGVTSLIDQALRIFPLVLSILAFWLLYSIVPTRRVPGRDALIGAVVAVCCSSWAKRLCALCYDVSFVSVNLRRAGGDPHPVSVGLLDRCIVLLGAEVTVTLDDYRQLKQQERDKEREET